MKRPSVYVKMKVLGAIEVAAGRTRHERIHSVAAMTFLDEQGDQHQFTWRTIQTWYYRYKNHGVTGMDASPRADKGRTRKVTPEEVLEAINTALPHFVSAKTGHKRTPTKSAVYRFCIEKGLLHASQIALTTFCRFVREYELLKDDPGENRRRLAFSMQYANQLWQADTMFGPHIGGRQAKLIALIDDASRVICHGEFFFEENTDSMIKALRSAFYKRGLPEQLYVDNGSIYCSQEITLIAARVGCILRHTAVRDAAAKGKVERFFRRVRDQFLIRKLDLTSIEALNKQFTHWVEHDYNATVHTTLGMKPIDRFGVDLSRIRFLSPSEDTDELFYAEAMRSVKKDNTFSFQGERYETPIDLRGKKVTLRHERHHKGAVVVYENDRRIGKARLLDAVANGMKRRTSAEER
ncbi:DDE-type integrase/transposase/recombinase [Allorhodopirellula solitaria]|uniref:Integrase core domain protein n=1 Tax=Allorhodopirellula solitaria TaxID=2527987 RepID=A0A5C5X1H4_9BACT|nr:DDE-type integrase/transposase/recombinase [Allorhodopirellula solitaria]TWT56005.1 Integrase core domain protein [Allorhodopirellula solitaria]